MPGWLVVSIVASLVLTLVANLVLRLPGVRQRVDDTLTRAAEAPPGGAHPDEPWPWDGPSRAGARRSTVRVFFPWKAMLLISIVLTVVLNLLARLGR